MSLAQQLQFDRSFDLPADRVFDALTEGPHLARWFCDECESEPRLDGRLVMRWTRSGASAEDFVARWWRFEPAVAASFQGGHRGYPDGDAGLVEFLLARGEGITHLSVRHSLPDTASYEPIANRYRETWPRALARLTEYLNSTTPTRTA
ncbi:MAG: SRPBCC domain-containing protein [Candidatus Eisenbacteria bacterium]